MQSRHDAAATQNMCIVPASLEQSQSPGIFEPSALSDRVGFHTHMRHMQSLGNDLTINDGLANLVGHAASLQYCFFQLLQQRRRVRKRLVDAGQRGAIRASNGRSAR